MIEGDHMVADVLAAAWGHMSAIDKIEHVVVLILENHSFDQMLGCMNAVYPGLNGIDLDVARYVAG